MTSVLRGGVGVLQKLILTDMGEGGGPEWPKIDWRHLWTAPIGADLFFDFTSDLQNFQVQIWTGQNGQILFW